MKNKVIFCAVCAFFLCGCGSAESGVSLDYDRVTKAQTESSAEDTTDDVSASEGVLTEGVLAVHVCGAVNNAGVYELESGSRIVDALEMAGGVTEEGAVTVLNLAELLYDGEQVYVPTWTEVSEGYSVSAVQTEGEGTALVNINTAGKEELMTLKGIGESLADAIIEYRQSSGGFSSIEDLMQVSGIGETSFEKLRPYITVD